MAQHSPIVNGSLSALPRLESALQLAAWGWSVFPLHEVLPSGACSCKRGPACGSQAGKHPRLSGWQQVATTDPLSIQDWWKRWPGANIGVPTGPASGLWVVGPDGPDGREALAELERQHGSLPPTPTADTGSGGEHRYFHWPVGLTLDNARNHRGLPIDIRGAGGLVVAPGSRNCKGPYLWRPGHSPADVPVADAPDWLLEWAGAEPLLQDEQGQCHKESSSPWLLVAPGATSSRERAQGQRA